MYLESDVGVSIHSEDIETRFSFRTRVLEYLWAGLPVIATEGDAMADLVRAHDLGAVVRCRDAESLAAALVDLSEPKRRTACSERVRRVADGFLWSKVAAPLADYCRNPFVAPDRAAARARIEMGAAGGGEVSRLMRRSLQVLRTDGAGAVLGRGREYLRRRGRGR
jgi:hypothetical protein